MAARSSNGRQQGSPKRADKAPGTAGETEAAVAYRQLRDRILRAQLRPGAPLIEGELLKLLGVGRTPLRDALHQLDHEGLVEIMPRRGTFVTQVTLRDLQQIFEVRSGLEDIVARLAVERCTPADLAEFAQLRDRACGEQGSNESDVALDAQLHALLLRIGQNHLLEELYRRVADASLRLLYLTRCGMESRAEQCATLTAAHAALGQRDANALAETMRAHVRAFRDRVARSLFSAADAMLQ
jgi:DNA-binding GntR family transcriptional regulator